MNATVWISIVGIVVSGVVGPQLTSWSARRANHKQFNRDQNAHRREDLRALLDEAAVLLASGATNLRHLRENDQQKSAELSNWLSQVFPLGQRLRLRLREDNQVVRSYDDVREALVKAGETDIEIAISEFETKRRHFLDLARKELSKEIPEDGEIE